MSETEQEIHEIVFALPADQDAFDAALEGMHLREIIESTYHYLSLLGQDNRVKVSAVMTYMNDRIKSMDLQCLQPLDKSSQEDNEEPFTNCIR